MPDTSGTCPSDRSTKLLRYGFHGCVRSVPNNQSWQQVRACDHRIRHQMGRMLRNAEPRGNNFSTEVRRLPQSTWHHTALLTDQGRNFESEIMKEIWGRYGIEKRMSPYPPQANGQTERFNRTMNEMLSQYVGENEMDWDISLPTVLFAYRSAKHQLTASRRSKFYTVVALAYR